ncbi:MAG: extracellular solute-binding protein [Gammaproteobacteria bacterium]|nr:extracellular solute-binding protein [Gammaproteobacteria bacterium]
MKIGFIAVVVAFLSAPVAAERLVINTNTSDELSKSVFEAIIETFEAANPGIEIQWNVYERSNYRESFDQFIQTNPPDVASGLSPNRLLPYIQQGLIKPLSEEETSKRWALETNRYPWGLMLNAAVLEEIETAGLANFEALLSTCAQIRQQNLTPIALGTRFLWTAAAWFEYINLRINGPIFHRQLTQGEVSFLDPRVVAVFGMWRRLIDAECFNVNHAELSWQDAAQQVADGQAAMQLIGSFALNALADRESPESTLLMREFPSITPGWQNTLVAPSDTVVIPAAANNPEAATAFLAFLGNTVVQQQLAQARGQWPANEVEITEEMSLWDRSNLALLQGTSSRVSFFDREVPTDLAKAAMSGFRAFLENPEQLNAILGAIEAVRKKLTR